MGGWLGCSFKDRVIGVIRGGGTELAEERSMQQHMQTQSKSNAKLRRTSTGSNRQIDQSIDQSINLVKSDQSNNQKTVRVQNFKRMGRQNWQNWRHRVQGTHVVTDESEESDRRATVGSPSQSAWPHADRRRRRRRPAPLSFPSYWHDPSRSIDLSRLAVRAARTRQLQPPKGGDRSTTQTERRSTGQSQPGSPILRSRSGGRFNSFR